MHIREEELEGYLLDRLESSQASSLESHLATCSACARRLSSVGFFDQLVELSRKQTVLKGTEKRREPRLSTKDSAILQTISPFSQNRLNIQILDVSKGGMKVGVPNLLRPGASVKIRLKGRIAFGEVRHCREVGEGYEAGIQLFDALPV